VKPFRPRGVINSAVLEAVMVSLLENKNISSGELPNKYAALLGDKDFLESITGGTTDTLVLKHRLGIARRILGNVKA
jgi:hypothetical protein